MGRARDLLLGPLRELIKSKNDTTNSLHKRTGLARSFLDGMLKGERDFGIDTYEKLLHLGYGLQFDWVFFGPEPSKSKAARDAKGLHWQLDLAIENATKAGRMDALAWSVHALVTQSREDAEALPHPDNPKHQKK